MGTPRTTFLKRQREQNRKDKARAKQERLAARRAAKRSSPEPLGGPETLAPPGEVDVPTSESDGSALVDQLPLK